MTDQFNKPNKPNELVLRALARAFTDVGNRRGIDEWVEIGSELNHSADALVANAEPPEKASTEPNPKGTRE